jgi:hypothetical protein
MLCRNDVNASKPMSPRLHVNLSCLCTYLSLNLLELGTPKCLLREISQLVQAYIVLWKLIRTGMC